MNFNFLGWANLCRSYVRMRLITAVATMIAEAIGGEGPQRWLTIDFTADPRWL